MNTYSAYPAQALSAYTFFTNLYKIQHIQHEHTQAHMHTYTHTQNMFQDGQFLPKNNSNKKKGLAA